MAAVLSSTAPPATAAPAPTVSRAALTLEGVSKRFGHFLALDEVSITLRAGEVHALLGENGAGKSTLCNLICGVHTPTVGQMTLDGHPYAPRSPKAALKAGVAMVHQHFSLIPTLSVLDNLVLGHSTREMPRALALQRLEAICAQYHLALSPSARVEDLTVGQMQQVEIAKCLLRQPQVLVLDEPTAVLDGQAIEALITSVRQFAQEGLAILLVTHKLSELRDAADRVSVLRHGRLVDHGTLAERDIDSFVNAMIGREVATTVEIPPAPERRSTRPRVMVDGVRLSRHGRELLSNVTLLVDEGEMVGIAGVEGNGQTELAAVLSGQQAAEGGRLFIADQETTRRTTAELRRQGVAIVPEDRHRDGCIAAMSVAHNLFLDRLPQFANRFGFENKTLLEAQARDRMQAFDVRADSPWQPMGSMSGGNQQKVVLARELSRLGLPAVIAAQPTRGLDLGAVQFIYRRLLDARNDGAAVVVFSSELDDLMTYCDRIAVLYKGRLIGPLKRPFQREQLGRLMAGLSDEADA